MPHLATPIWNSKSTSIPVERIPEGAKSGSNDFLVQRFKQLIENFYSSSESLSYYRLPFTLDASITLDTSILEKHARKTLEATRAKIYNLLTWEANWNSYRAVPPEYGVVVHADDWITKLFLTLEDAGLAWLTPNVTASPDGEVVFEWWYGTKKLTIYIGDQSAEYVQVWGADIYSEMSDGDAEPMDTCQSLWEWLISND